MNNEAYYFEDYKKIFYHDKHIVEVGCVDEVDNEYRRAELKTAYVAFKFPETVSSIENLVYETLKNLIVNRMPYSLESEDDNITIYNLELEDNVQLHFFNDTNVKKFIISSRNMKKDLRYNMLNAFFVIKTVLPEILEKYDFLQNDFSNYLNNFQMDVFLEDDEIRKKNVDWIKKRIDVLV